MLIFTFSLLNVAYVYVLSLQINILFTFLRSYLVQFMLLYTYWYEAIQYSMVDLPRKTPL